MRSFALIAQKIGGYWEITIPLQDAPPIVVQQVDRRDAISTALRDLDGYEGYQRRQIKLDDYLAAEAEANDAN